MLSMPAEVPTSCSSRLAHVPVSGQHNVQRSIFRRHDERTRRSFVNMNAQLKAFTVYRARTQIGASGAAAPLRAVMQAGVGTCTPIAIQCTTSARLVNHMPSRSCQLLYLVCSLSSHRH